MGPMPNIAAEILRDGGEAAEVLRRLMHPHLAHHHGAPPPAVTQPQPVIPHNGTQEEPMSFIDDAEAHAKAILDVFGQADREALRLMEAVKANPGALALVQSAEGYLHLPPAAFDIAINSLAGIARLYPDAAPQQPQAAPAGPQVGGQA